MLRNPELRRALLLGGLVTLLASAAAALLSGWRAACVTLALGVVLLGLYTVELCRRYRAMARLAADIDAVLHGSGDIHLADYGEGEVSLLRSEVRKMTLRLREQSAQLEKEKLQLADAMADISHQMRTPLTAVNLLLTSLAGHVDEESRGDVRAAAAGGADGLARRIAAEAGKARCRDGALLPGNHSAFGPAGAGGGAVCHRHGAARPAAAGRGFRERPL